MRTSLLVAGICAGVTTIAVLATSAASRSANPRSGPSAAVLPADAAALPLLHAARGGDGDSWHDTQNREYRVGLVNTPEFDECYGAEATAARKRLTANGFRAAVYAVDRYGRLVAVVTTAAGIDLNVYLARRGFANDRYLAQFRTENTALAALLDPAFAAAKAERAGLWGACPSPRSLSGLGVRHAGHRS